MSKLVKVSFSDGRVCQWDVFECAPDWFYDVFRTVPEDIFVEGVEIIETDLGACIEDA